MDQRACNFAIAGDHQLLRAYADDGSQAAFGELVTRHIDLVYSAARRQLGGGAVHLADDVTQAVFMILAQKARGHAIGERVVLAGWLYTTTRHAAANARKIEARRRRHERQGGAMPRSSDDDRSQGRWDDLAPMLDGALARLSRVDRDAVLLKFMQHKSHRAVGEALGISEEAARKRVSRALDRLRALLVRRANGTGVAVPAAAVLGTLLATNVVDAAPPALSAACALSGSTAAAASGAATAVANATTATLTWLQAKAVAACLALVSMALAGGIGYTAHRLYAQAPGGPPPPPAHQPATPVVPVAAPAAQAKPAAAEEPVRGVVVDADGHPLAGVDVYAGTPQQPVDLYDPTRQAAKPAVTGADGTFWLPRPAGNQWMIVATSPDGGVARVKPADLTKPADNGNPPRVVLQPWGRIEGRLLAGDRPLPGGRIYMGAWSDTEDPLSRCIVNSTSARTDRNGRFTIVQVAPGTVVLSQRDDRQPDVKFCKWETVDVAAGKPTTVDLGAVGRPVVGQLAVPQGWEGKVTFALDAVHWADITARRSDLTPMPIPPGYPTLPPAEQRQIRARWNQSAEAAEYRRNMYPEQYLPRPDGSFRLDALRPGKYQVAIRLFERDDVNSMLEDVASAYFDLTVAPTPAGTKFVSDPLDLGRIVLKPVVRVRVGQPAPAFQAFTVDGDPVRLADFKGRLLAVQFRFPRVANTDTAGIGKAHAAFANDPRVAFLTVHLNADANDVRRLIADEALEWPQAVASRAGPFPLPEGYMRGPAMIHLISGDGTLRRKVLRGNDLEAAIAQMLLEQEK
jgi:RNA polymerase sigma factor (sigma-70 family)